MIENVKICPKSLMMSVANIKKHWPVLLAMFAPFGLHLPHWFGMAKIAPARFHIFHFDYI